MKDGFFTKDSMFNELKDVVDYLGNLSMQDFNDTKKKLPAMIILEKQLNGMNKHAIAGRPLEVFILFEWGISQFASQMGISYEDVLEGIELAHKGLKHIVLQKEEYDLNDEK